MVAAAFGGCDARATGYVGDDWRAGRLRVRGAALRRGLGGRLTLKGGRPAALPVRTR